MVATVIGLNLAGIVAEYKATPATLFHGQRVVAHGDRYRRVDPRSIEKIQNWYPFHLGLLSDARGAYWA